MNETHIIYSKQLTLDINQQNIDIIRHRKLDIEFGCAYQLWNAGTLQTAYPAFTVELQPDPLASVSAFGIRSGHFLPCLSR